MSEEAKDAVEVLSGTVEPDLRWSVIVHGDQRELYTMLHVYRGVLTLTEPIERFGLRFAVAALPSGQGPGGIRIEHDEPS